MNGIPITEVTDHKHLGITLQSNGRWNNHIEDTVIKAQKRVDIIKGLTHKLDRKSLEKLYIAYIRSILEYSAIVFDNCTKEEAKKLEKVQIAAARVVTGAKRGTSHMLLYEELKWETLADRREKQKLKMFYKIKNNQTPEILFEQMPQTVANKTAYNNRSRENISIPKTRTSIHSYCIML